MDRAQHATAACKIGGNRPGDAEFPSAVCLSVVYGFSTISKSLAKGMGRGRKHACASSLRWLRLPQRRGRYQKRVAVVSFVARFKQRHGRAPSLPEMAAAFPTVSKSAAQRYRVAA